MMTPSSPNGDSGASDSGGRMTRNGRQDLARDIPMSESERVMGLVGGSMLLLWAVRHGGLIPTLVAVAAGSLAIGSTQSRWPSFMARLFRESQDRRPM